MMNSTILARRSRTASGLVGALSAGLFALVALAAASGPLRAADLPARATPALPVAPPAFTWTGLYAGVNAGYGLFGRGNYTDPTLGAVTGLGGRGGITGGVQAGYNYQFKPGSGVVAGLEADFQGAKLAPDRHGTLAGTPFGNVAPSLDYFGTVRGRVGYAFDRLLVYGTGGLAYSGGSRPSFAALYTGTEPRTSSLGYAVGGGVEYALTPAISAKVEALYVNLAQRRSEAASYDATSAAYYGVGRSPSDFGVVRAGLNYRFSTF